MWECALYIKPHENEYSTKTIKLIIEYNKMAFLEYIHSADWISGETKLKAMRKLKAIKE